LEVLEAALPFFLKILEVLGLPILTLFAIDGSCPTFCFAIDDILYVVSFKSAPETTLPAFGTTKPEPNACSYCETISSIGSTTNTT